MKELRARHMAPEHPLRWNETAVPWGEVCRWLATSPPDSWYYLQGERLLGPLDAATARAARLGRSDGARRGT